MMKAYGRLGGKMTRSRLIRHIGLPSRPVKTGHVHNSQSELKINGT